MTAPIAVQVVKTEFETNTFAIRADECMFPVVTLPSAFLERYPVTRCVPYEPPPPPAMKPTPLRDFLADRMLEIEDTVARPLLRAVLDVHKPRGLDQPGSTYEVDACLGCNEEGYMQDPAARHTDACLTLRALATAFGDHPDMPVLAEAHTYW